MKVKMTYQYFATGVDGTRKEGEPTSESKTVIIDTEVDRKYDGAKTTDDVRNTFLQGVTQDPLHSVELRVTECVEV